MCFFAVRASQQAAVELCQQRLWQLLACNARLSRGSRCRVGTARPCTAMPGLPCRQGRSLDLRRLTRISFCTHSHKVLRSAVFELARTQILFGTGICSQRESQRFTRFSASVLCRILVAQRHNLLHQRRGMVGGKG